MRNWLWLMLLWPAQLMVPSTVLALDCAPVPASPPMAAMPGCVHGVPVRSGELILVPRACHLTIDGKTVDRRSVDVRHGETGARVGQVSLPPAVLPPDQFVPGVVLAGDPPLLAYPTGIAALDPRANRAEVSFEPQGKLAGVARQGDLLLVVEELAADKQFPQGSLLATVIDQEAGEVLGEAQVAGTALEAVGLSVGRNQPTVVTLGRTGSGKSLEVASPSHPESGKPAKNRVVAVVASFKPEPVPAACVLLPDASAAVVRQSPVRVQDGKLVMAPQAGFTVVSTPAGDVCAAVGGLTATGAERAGMAWYDRGGKAQLQAVRCK